ncbi:MAG: tRNA (adenosine(37)-N6)-dimethylallyltransferase MiaA [Erysipelotrichales bacterium]
MDKVICIVGPTGIGKTSLSIALAKYLDGEIINGDLIQMFKEVDILSAKPSIEEQSGFKHHLLDFLCVEENYDVARFKKDASKLIEEINNKGKIPIIVGGSGLYIKSLLFDYKFDDVKQRASNINEKYESYTNEELFDYLKDVDEKTSSILHPNNRKRVLRAIEIYETSGKAKSEHLDKQEHVLEYDALVIGLNNEREIIYDLINKRVDKMVNIGLVEEVESLYKKYNTFEYQPFQAIGYKEFRGYLEDDIELEIVLDKIKQNSRRYAKKQLTWFNNQMDVNWLISNIDDFDKTINDAIKLVEDFING